MWKKWLFKKLNVAAPLSLMTFWFAYGLHEELFSLGIAFKLWLTMIK